MEFGPRKTKDCASAILAHSIRTGTITFKKGRVLTDSDVAELETAGIMEIYVARLGPDDVEENLAAARVGDALEGPDIKARAAFTGRVNLHAEADGLLLADAEAIDAVNRLGEAITIATRAPFARIECGEMVATVKIIPFAAPLSDVERALARLNAARPALRLAAFKEHRVVLIATETPTEKSVRITAERVANVGGTLMTPVIAAKGHDADAVKDAIAIARAQKPDLLLIQGASATIDRADAVPAGIIAAGGRITHFGMPVDPGNLLLLARMDDIPVVVLPGCARSPKESGFDFVLERIAAGLDVSSLDIQKMGVGGLLKEIVTRPQPREARPQAEQSKAKIAALILAAGLSRRMGANKLLMDAGGETMIRKSVAAYSGLGLDPVIVVTGRDAPEVGSALSGLGVKLVYAERFAEGMSHSLRAGLQALGTDIDAVLVGLGDMPLVSSADIERLALAFDPMHGKTIAVPMFKGRRGNPVVFGRAHFAELMKLEGDMGGRPVIEANRDAVVEVEMPGDAILKDADTPEALAALKPSGR